MRAFPPATAMAARRLAVGAALLAATLTAGPVAATAAPGTAGSLGSVPDEVEEYITEGDLLADLRDVYGLDASGERGTDFTDETETGEIVRVFAWTDDYLAGVDTEDVVRLLNEWIVPVLVDEEPVGLATVWIQPETVLPELAAFVPDPELATALSEVPAKASLVHDEGADAWFALEGDTLTPLVPGRSGLESPAPLDVVAIVPPAEEAAPEATGTGVPIAAGAVVLLLAAIAIALLLPKRLSPTRRTGRPDADGSDDHSPVPGGDDETVLRPQQSLARTGRAIQRAAERDEATAARPPVKPHTPRLGRELKRRRS